MQNLPSACFTPSAIKYAQDNIISGDIKPEIKEKFKENLKAIATYNKVIEILVEKEREQENEDVRCGCSTVINKPKVSPEIAKLQQLAKNCPATGGVFKIGSDEICLSKEGTQDLLRFVRERSKLPRLHSSPHPITALTSRRREGHVKRQGCTIM